MRTGLWAGVVACALLSTSLAEAQARVVLLEFDGPLAERARGAVLEALSQQYAMIPRQDAESAAAGANADLTTAEGRVTVARALQLTAFVDGSVSKRGPKLEVVLTVYDGGTGAATEAGRVRATRAGLPRMLREEAAAALSGPLASSSVPAPVEPVVAAAPTPEPAEAPPPEPVAKPPEPHREPKAFMLPPEELEPPADADEPDALELRLGARLLTRGFEYTDAESGMAEHSLSPTPAFDLGLRWYPGAHVDRGVAAIFGIEASGSFMLPAEVERAGVAYQTKSFGFGIGAHARIPLGDHALGVLAGYGQNAYAIDDGDDGSDPGIADVAYGFVRAGIDARIALSKAFGLAPRVAYRVLLGYGELEDADWYSRTGGGGLEAELLLRYAVLPELTLDLGGGLVRYFLSFDPDPDDPVAARFGIVANGAEDQQLYGTLGVTLGI